MLVGVFYPHVVPSAHGDDEGAGVARVYVERPRQERVGEGRPEVLRQLALLRVAVQPTGKVSSLGSDLDGRDPLYGRFLLL